MFISIRIYSKTNNDQLTDDGPPNRSNCPTASRGRHSVQRLVRLGCGLVLPGHAEAEPKFQGAFPK